MIDWLRMSELRDEIGQDGFDEVVDVFLEEADEVLARLIQDPLPTQEDLHFLKGSALNLGLSDLAAICQEGERKAAAGLAVDIAQVAAIWQASRAGLLGGLSAGQAGAA